MELELRTWWSFALLSIRIPLLIFQNCCNVYCPAVRSPATEPTGILSQLAVVSRRRRRKGRKGIVRQVGMEGIRSILFLLNFVWGRMVRWLGDEISVIGNNISIDNGIIKSRWRRWKFWDSSICVVVGFSHTVLHPLLPYPHILLQGSHSYLGYLPKWSWRGLETTHTTTTSTTKGIFGLWYKSLSFSIECFNSPLLNKWVKTRVVKSKELRVDKDN